MSVNALEFHSVDFFYGCNNVLQSATFDVHRGDFISIVGPNGGGKTTLLKLVLGLISPQKGTIRLFDDSVVAGRSRVGYSPQFLSVDFAFPVSVLDVVLMGRLRSGIGHLWYSRIDHEAAFAALQTLKLESHAHRPFPDLSGGERQRVLIARAICGEPEMLLLDEPTNNIDSTSEQILFDILLELNRKMTILMVSHDIGFVSRCVKKVICVNRTVAVHSTAQMNGKTIHDLYGDHPVNLVVHDCCSEMPQ
ncbi:MAG: metal ABC transporter ATP-binding protein [Thermoguttaceae bacterium]